MNKNIITTILAISILSFARLCFASEPVQPVSITLDILKVGDRIVPFQSGMPLPTFERQDREYLDLAGKWKKQRVEVDHRLSLRARSGAVISLIEKESGNRQASDFNDSAWESFQVPGVENYPPDRYQGGVWYRRNFEVPAAFKGKLVRLMFEGANYVADVWINGKWAGTHEGGYTPFAFDATDLLNYGGRNAIAVRVDNIPWLPMGQDESGNKANDKNIVPYKTCDWWNYTGILRGVYLEAAPDISIARADVKPQLTGENTASLEVGAVVFNRNARKAGAKLKVSVYEAKITRENILEPCAKAVADFSRPVKFAGQAEFDLEISKEKVSSQTMYLAFPSVKFWSPENPQLYVLELALEGKGVSDRYYTQFGFREIRVDAKECRVLINKEPVFLRGMSRTEVFAGEKEMDLPADKFMLRDLRIMKDMNVDFIRAGHWPNSTLMYMLADRLGFAVWEEIPAFWLDGPSFDIQRKDRKVAWQMFLEMIYKDYNRPSVMFFGTCNECGWGKERILYIQNLKQTAYMVDGTRLVAQSAVGSDPGDKTQVDCDVMGFTMYYGVFYGKGSVYDDTMEALEKMHESFPAKPIIATEYGYWSESEMTSAQEQVRIAKETIRALKDHSAVAGAVWWAGFDWHTMITDPQTMGAVRGDRKFFKPVYYEIQKNYADFAGAWPISIVSPAGGRVSGAVQVSASVPKDMPAKEMKYSVDGGEFTAMAPQAGVYSAPLNTSKLSEGRHELRVRGVGPAGQVMSKQADIIVDNTDDLPSVELIYPKEKDRVMGRIKVSARIEDDRGVKGAEVTFGAGSPQAMAAEGDGIYSAYIDTTKQADLKQYQLKVSAVDTGGQVSRKAAGVTVDNAPGIYVELPYNDDWIASKDDLGDGTGYDFPSDYLPDSGSQFIFNSKEGPVKFLMGRKEPLQRNNLECRGQTLQTAYGRYSRIYFLGCMHNTAAKLPFTLLYTDGTSQKVYAPLSDWWRGTPVFGEETAFFMPKHIEKDGLKKPGVGIYFQSLPVDEKRILKAVVVPAEDRAHIFAMTCSGKIVTDLPPTVRIKSPADKAVLQGKFTPEADIPDTDIAGITYFMDGQKVPAGELDSTRFADGRHEFEIVAEDKQGQLGRHSVEVFVSNNHNIVSPAPDGKISRVLKIVMNPRHNTKVEQAVFSVDKGDVEPLMPDAQNVYAASWPVPAKFKPGSRHTLTVTVKEAGGRTIEKRIQFQIAVPLEGHTVKVDKNILDWLGKAPGKENSYALSNNEFIWKDAIGDDNGNGSYAYPLSPSFKNSADIKEVRITFDKKCLYFLIRAGRPGDWWAPYRLIGIHKEGSTEQSTEVLAEGSLDQVAADNGCYGEVRVAPELACQYIIGTAGTYKGRIWNAKGDIIAKKESSPADTPDFMVDDDNWENIEIAVPFSVIGNPKGQTWKFIIGMGTQDGEMLREVAGTVSEWNGGGGEGEAGSAGGVDPDLYDLAGGDRKGQQLDLGGYLPGGKAGDAKAFSVIKNSFLEITFAE